MPDRDDKDLDFTEDIQKELDEWDSMFDSLHTGGEIEVDAIPGGKDAASVDTPDAAALPGPNTTIDEVAVGAAPATPPPPVAQPEAPPEALEDVQTDVLPNILAESASPPPGFDRPPEDSEDGDAAADLDALFVEIEAEPQEEMPDVLSETSLPIGDLPPEAVLRGRQSTQPPPTGYAPENTDPLADVEFAFDDSEASVGPFSQAVQDLAEERAADVESSAPRRVGPAIVRRDELQRMRQQREEAPPRGRNTTSELEFDRLEELAHESESTFDEPTPERGFEVELDTDFYDEIEIDEDDAAAQSNPPAMPIPRPESSPRRTAHIIRRQPDVDIPPETEAAILELEADFRDEFDDELDSPSDDVLSSLADEIDELAGVKQADSSTPPAGVLGEVDDLFPAFSDEPSEVDHPAVTGDPADIPRPGTQPGLGGEALPGLESDLEISVETPAPFEAGLPDLSLDSAPPSFPDRASTIALGDDADILEEVTDGSAQAIIDADSDNDRAESVLEDMVIESEPAVVLPTEADSDAGLAQPEPVAAIALPEAEPSPIELPDQDVPPDLPDRKFADPPDGFDLQSLDLTGAQPLAVPQLSADLDALGREAELLDEPSRLARLLTWTARTAEEANDVERARDCLASALENDPRLAIARRALRRIERRQQNFDEVAELLEREASTEGIGDAERRALREYRAHLLVATGRHDDARPAVQELCDETPSDVRYLLLSAQLAFHSGGSGELLAAAIADLSRAIPDERLKASLLVLRALAAEPDDSVALLEQAAAIDAEDPLVRFAAGGSEASPGGAFGGDPALAAAVELFELDAQRRAGQLESLPRSLAEIAVSDAAVASIVAPWPGASDVPAVLEAAAAASSEPSVQARTLMRGAFSSQATEEQPHPRLDVARKALELDPHNQAATQFIREFAASDGGDNTTDTLAELARARDPSGPDEQVRAIADIVGQLRAIGQRDPHLYVDEMILSVAGDDSRDARIEILSSRIGSDDPASDAADPAADRRRLARLLVANGDNAAAAALYRELSADGDDDHLYARLAQDRLDIAADTADDGGARASSDAVARYDGAADPYYAVSLAIGSRATERDLVAEVAERASDDPRQTIVNVVRCATEKDLVDAGRRLAEFGDTLGGDAQISFRYRGADLIGRHTEDAEAATELLGTVLEKRPDFSAATELASHLDRSGDARKRSLTGAASPLTSHSPADEFAGLLRAAEATLWSGDAHDAIELYEKALTLREGDPIAAAGLVQAARVAGEAAPVAALALAKLKRAETESDALARADAYEQLAMADAELRGDESAALLAWESAANADPTRVAALRKLERAYQEGDRGKDLLRLYGRLLALSFDTPDYVPLLLERARVAERQNRPSGEIQADYQRAFEIDRTCRPALFALESASRLTQPSPAVADIERAVAEVLSGDPRATAGFLTRAGETLQTLGDLEGSIDHFKQAVAAAPGYNAALAGWRDAAMSGQLWGDMADAAIAEAADSASDAERARLYHVAGVALMDHALNSERAAEALRSCLAVDPSHDDAFVRLRILYDEAGEYEDLAQLLDARIGVETEPASLIALHLMVAELSRNFLDDRRAALRHLAAVRKIDPSSKRAVAEMSDITFELGAWKESAHLLMARAKLETDPDVQRAIFRRLGTIYADHLPEPALALRSFAKVLTFDPADHESLERIADLASQTGEWKVALGSCERLLKAEGAPEDARLRQLLRMATIYEQGFGNRQHAERALRMAIDSAPHNDDVLDRLVEFYDSSGDTRSLQIHLDRLAGAMRTRLATAPFDPIAHRVIARALRARGLAGVAGSFAPAVCAAELSEMLGESDEELRRLIGSRSSTPQSLASLGMTDLDDFLSPRTVPSGVRNVFRLLGPRIGRLVGGDLRDYGVGRGQRLKVGRDPVANTVAEVARGLGFDSVEVYVSTTHPAVAVGMATNPVSVVLGADIASAERPRELMFAAARALKLVAMNLADVVRVQPDRFAAILAGILGQFRSDGLPPSVAADVAEAEIGRARKLFTPTLLSELAPFAVAVDGNASESIWHGIQMIGTRAGVIASGSAAAALTVSLKLGGYRTSREAGADPRVIDLVRFAVSDDHARIRAALDG